MNIKKTLTKHEKMKLRWQYGLLDSLCQPHQEKLYGDIWQALEKQHKKYAINCSRRFGKTTVCGIIAIEYAIRNPNSRITFATKTYKQMREIVKSIFSPLLNDSPIKDSIKWQGIENKYIFPNGSEIRLCGLDNQNHQNIRGVTNHLVFVDEAGFIDDLEYVINSVLLPTTLTTNGCVIMISTPSDSIDHPFKEYCEELQLKQCFSKFTIYDNTSLSKDAINNAIKESGGESNTTFRREYLCEFITDSSRAVIPEWSNEYIVDKHDVIDDNFQHYFKFTAMDLGVTNDFTAPIFAFYHFEHATLYIIDEDTMIGKSLVTNDIADKIKQKELDNFKNMKIKRRIVDNNNPQLVNDLSIVHKLPFQAVTKTSLDAMINKTRTMVKNGRIKIHKECLMTIGALESAIWNKTKDKLAHSKTYGHYDHLMALVYLIQSCEHLFNENTMPIIHSQDVWINRIEQNQKKQQLAQALMPHLRKNY